MKQPLPEALADLATEARTYADAEAVVAARRRRVRTVTGLSAAALAAATAGALVLVAPTGSDRPGVTQVVPGASASAAGPRRVELPKNPPRLPAERGVGRAELVHAACHRTCPPLLLTVDGRHFALDVATQWQQTNWITLSPDGRWLGQREGAAYVVRDLTGTQRLVLRGNWDPWSWSPDSRWLVLADHHDGSVRTYTRLDLRSGDTTVLTPQPGWGPAFAVLPTGHVLVPKGDVVGGRRPLNYAIIDPASGRAVRSITVDVRAALRRGEVVWPELVRVSADGKALLVTVFEDREPDASRPSAVVVADLADRRVTARHDLPESGRGAADPGGVWSPEEPVSGGMLLVHAEPDRTSVVRLDLATGRRATILELPPDGPVLVPGRARY